MDERKAALRGGLSAFGERSNHLVMSDEWTVVPGYDMAGFEHAAGYSTVGYSPKGRGSHCAANKNTCKAFKVKGKEYCAGHLRAFAKAKREGREEQ